jgi:hypothetical protein
MLSFSAPPPTFLGGGPMGFFSPDDLTIKFVILAEKN